MTIYNWRIFHISIYIYRGFLKWGYPWIIHFNRVFHYIPSILGYPHLWKPPLQKQTGAQGVLIHFLGYIPWGLDIEVLPSVRLWSERETHEVQLPEAVKDVVYWLTFPAGVHTEKRPNKLAHTHTKHDHNQIWPVYLFFVGQFDMG